MEAGIQVRKLLQQSRREMMVSWTRVLAAGIEKKLMDSRCFRGKIQKT